MSEIPMLTIDQAMHLLVEAEDRNIALRRRLATEAPQRRKALAYLHQIYNLGIDPQNEHLSANVVKLLSEAATPDATATTPRCHWCHDTGMVGDVRCQFCPLGDGVLIVDDPATATTEAR